MITPFPMINQLSNDAIHLYEDRQYFVNEYFQKGDWSNKNSFLIKKGAAL